MKTKIPYFFRLCAVIIGIFFTSNGFSQPVNSAYHEKLLADSKTDLQGRVNRGEMTSERANLIIEIIDDTCRAAIRDGLTVPEYEGIFGDLKEEDCEQLAEQIYPLMEGYEADDIEMVIQKVEKMCADRLASSGNRLGLMMEMRTYLKSLGIW
jgi:hypothetical protein